MAKKKEGRRERGTGSIYQRGDSYVAQIFDGYKEDGKPRYRQVRAKTHAEAVKALNDFNARIALGTPILEGRSPTLDRWLDMWLNDHIKPNREPMTLRFYKLYVDRYIKPHLGRTDIRRIRAVDVTRLLAMLEEKGATKTTLSAVRRTLRAAMTVAMKHGLCGDNPVSKTFAPRVRRKPKVFFNAEQIQALLSALQGSPIENLVKFTLATGLRIGEATAVRWDNVDFSRQTVLVDAQLQRFGKKLQLKPLKTEKGVRTMPLLGHSLDALTSEKARQVMEPYENPLRLVFLNPWGRPMDPKFVNVCLHEALNAAKLAPTGMHSLRHSAATFLLMAGLNMHQVSRYLGHSQIALTSNLYGHVLDESMRATAKSLQEAYFEPN